MTHTIEVPREWLEELARYKMVTLEEDARPETELLLRAIGITAEKFLK